MSLPDIDKTIAALELEEECTAGFHADQGQALRDAITLMRRMQWQPIETAPKDSTWVIVSNAKKVSPAYLGNSYFSYDPAWITYAHRSECETIDFVPTHWQPLPEPPPEGA